MQLLRKGTHGPDVQALQRQLIAAGFRLNTDSHFGTDTENALRAFQRKRGLVPDGVAGPVTRQALAGVGQRNLISTTPMLNQLVVMLGSVVISAAIRAKHFALSPHERSRHPAHLTTSHNGMLFLYGREALFGVSNLLHWPGGGSGVTLGPGYDMGERSAAEISADLQKVGIDRANANNVAKAAGLKGEVAEKFVKENVGMIDMTRFPGSEFSLLKLIIPRYEKIVRGRLSVDLYQHQFDALVSFAYNPGPRFGEVAGLINRGETGKAMQVIKSVNKSGGKELPGLNRRRQLEVALYLYADYGVLPKVN